MTLLVPQQIIALNAIEFMPTDLFHLVTSTLDHPAAKITPPRTIDDDQAKELAWLEQQFTMQSRDDPGAANLPVWTTGNLPWVTVSADGQRAISSSQPEILHNDGTLEALVNNESVHAVDVPVQYASFQEDELLSWLQYPLEDPMDRGYCSNMFGDIPNANAQIVKHSFTQIGLEPQETTMSITPASASRGFAPNPDIQGLSTRNTIFQNNGAMGICSNDACESKNKVAGADAAMAVGAGRAAGLSSQCGAEVFHVVRATIQPSLPKCSNSVISPSANSKSLDFQPPLLSHLPNEGPSQRQNPFIPYNNTPFQALNSMDTAPFFTPPPPPGMISARNFSHFSLPVAQTKANLHMVGAGSGPTNLDRVRQQFGKSGRMELNAMDSSLEESITTVSGLGSYVAQLQVDEAARYVLPPERGKTTASSSCGQESDMGRERISNIINSSMCNSALTASEKGVETLGTADQTATSPSRGSGNSTEKSGKEAATTSKRKFSGGDDSEYQSEDVEEIAMNNKKPPSGAKRTRAAEMHNQSERRRRDRIKDRMKALQDLIPNANKTDKASMLDEAIEYMKLLQSQLQMMSMRTGIGIPPSMMPTMGVQHLQMPALPNMGLGMGMGMGVGLGMGMGLMDVNAATAGHTMVPMPFACRPAVGPACHPAGLQSCTPSLNMADTHDHLQSSSIMDPYSFYLLQQQMQPASVNMNMHRNLELYNAYMQQQRWQQHLQQSQQSQGNNGSNPS